MALPNQLKSARMSDSTDRSTIDNHVGDIEQAVCDILGVTIDQDISAAILGAVDSSGRITGKPRIYGAGNAAGLRFRDSGAGKEFLIACASSYLIVYENTGTEGTPVWTQRWSLSLAKGLAHHTVNPYCWAQRSAAQSVPNTTTTDLDLNSDFQDPDDWHDPVTNPERITVPEEGIYLMTASVDFATAASGDAVIYLYGGGSNFGTSGFIPLSSAGAITCVASGIRQMSAGQWAKVQVWQSSGGALDVGGQCIVQMCKVSG